MIKITNIVAILIIPLLVSIHSYWSVGGKPAASPDLRLEPREPIQDRRSGKDA